MNLAPDEICRRFGEAKFKEMFHALGAAAMKKVMAEAGIPPVRLPGHTSTRKRNEDWARRLWSTLLRSQGGGACAVLLFEWFTHHRNDMLAAFLDALGVAHERGLTDVDFLNQADEERLLSSAQGLIESGRFDRREVAAYLMFLDITNKSEKFASLNLEQHLTPDAEAQPQAG